MEKILVGRKEEQAILQKALASSEAEMVAIIGRRRVGKTFLVNEVYRDQIAFGITGTQNGATARQLQNFRDQLEAVTKPYTQLPLPGNWQEAFKMLRLHLQELLPKSKEKKVLFFDELPWLAGHRSGFLEAFGYFWNSWASQQPLVVVICGSAASWMIQRVVNDRGGLHNRITRRIFLLPFKLSETEQYLRSRGVVLDRYQLVQIYMAMGGIPHYLKEIESGKSAVQNIDAICFSRQGLLSDEFERLYPSLFAKAENHIAIARALAEKKQGMTRNELATASKISNGGGLSKVLTELTQSGFMSESFPFGKKKNDKIYRLTDPYSLFFLQFIEQNRYQGNNPWQHLSQTAAYKSWAGLSFEGVCLEHIAEIKHAMGIAGVYTRASAFYKKGSPGESGFQIDLILDRNDHTINLFEAKFYNQPFSIDKEYAEKLRQKLWAFQQETKTTKQVSWVFITTLGLLENTHSIGLLGRALVLNDLF